ncbi:TIGR00269 family protein [Candidatus Woesearchaeota archaeon]|nr:TIGR00269 family protein [Candidatus Woesearchaeota archaeon]
MPCKRCKSNPVIQLPNSNIKLCKSCFIKYFERKVLNTIRKYNLINHKENIISALSGGKDSLSLLYLLNKIASKKLDFKLSALLVDEGIKGYRDKTIKTAREFCEKNNIKLHITSYSEVTGKTLDKIKKQFPDTIACSMCGVLRRYLLNKKSRELKANKLATGHNLDDEAQSIMMNQFRHNIALSARLGPITGVKRDKRFVPRIKPFYFLTEKEVATYAFINGLMDEFNECTYCTESNRFVVRDMLNSLEQKYPGTKHSIVASFLEVLPLLKEKYKNQKINSCKICSEPASSEVCNACNLLQRIRQ